MSTTHTGSDDRLKILQERNGKELSLAVEGRYTNLRIWVGYDGTVAENKVNPATHVWMRLDEYNQYSAPLDLESAGYVNNPVIKTLAEKFGFMSSIDNLSEILELTKNMKVRECLPW